MKKSRFLTLIRILGAFIALLILFYLTESPESGSVILGEPPVLYSNQAQDNLEEIFEEAILDAKKSILLIIYSLNDKKIINALNQKANENVQIEVIHDPKTPQFGFNSLLPQIEQPSQKLSGLMHQKILIIDKEKIWIGSANMTTDSLKLHDNLVIALQNPQIANLIEQKLPFFESEVAEQKFEFWNLPKKGKNSLNRLIQLLDEAQQTIRVAMFTFTHPELIDALIRAHKRGVEVEVVLDRDQAFAVSYVALEALARAQINLSLSSGVGLLHHKFAWIDEQMLINGSANWTRSAFTRNRDCFVVLAPLTPSQKDKMESVWKNCRAYSKRYRFKEAA